MYLWRNCRTDKNNIKISPKQVKLHKLYKIFQWHCLRLILSGIVQKNLKVAKVTQFSKSPSLRWSKHNSNSTFHVAMGSYGGAKICKFIGLFILNSPQNLFGKDIGLYRDDGLVVLNTKSGRLGDKARQTLTHALNDFGLNCKLL